MSDPEAERPPRQTPARPSDDLLRSITATRFFNKWVDIVLSVVSIVQGLAFSHLAQRLPFVWERAVVQRDYLTALYYLCCVAILIRVFQTYVLAALDYEEWNVSFSDVLFVFVIGFLEYLIFDAIRPTGVDVRAFHSHSLVLSGLGLYAYTSTLSKLRPSRFAVASLYRSEVDLQRANIVGSVALAATSGLVLFSSDHRLWMPVAVVGIVVPAWNIWYSLKKTISLRIQIVPLPIVAPREFPAHHRESHAIRAATAGDVDMIGNMLADEFYYVYEALFETSPSLTKDLLRRLLTANGGHHNLGYRSFFVALSPDNDQPVGMMLLSPPTKYGWQELKASSRFMLTLCRHLGLPKVLRVVRNLRTLSTIVPIGDGEAINISYIAVAVGHRRRDVASSLVHFAGQYAKGAGAHVLLAEIRDSNEAGLKLFERCGFAEIAVLKSPTDSIFSKGARVLVQRPVSAREIVTTN